MLDSIKGLGFLLFKGGQEKPRGQEKKEGYVLDQRDFVQTANGRKQVIKGVLVAPTVRVGNNGWRVVGAQTAGDLITCLVAEAEPGAEGLVPIVGVWPISQLHLPLTGMNQIRHALGRAVRTY